MKQVLCFLVLIAVVLSFASAELRKQKENPYEGLGADLAGEPVIGIDLGTTYSCVALYRPNASQSVEIIPNELGNRITPSVISFDFESGEKYVGDAAKNNAPFNPKNTFYDVKRLIGRRFGEVTRDEKNMFSYDVTEKEGRAHIKAQFKADEPQKVIAPEEISAMVLQKMKQIAEKYLNKPVKYAVVTVPAYFNDQQRQATKDAGKIAGLQVLRIINEPTAASMAYGLKKEKEHNILVFDLGGGTFDVSLVTIDNGVFEVVATSGDTHLGGEDFDMRVVNHFVAQFKKKHGKDIAADKRAFQKLKLEAEKAKRQLSFQTEFTIEIEKLIDGIDFSEKLTRAQFEALNNDLFQKTLVPVRQVLKDAGLEKTDIDEVVLVGGSTRIPKVQELLSKFFDGKKLNQEVNPDEAVCYGAAIQGAILGNQMQGDLVLIDVTPLSLGIETQDGLMATIIPRNTPIPSEKSDTFTTTSDYQTTMLIPIYEGERRIAKKNRKLGELELNEIPPAPRGVPQVKVIFKLDQNGILTVVAENQDTKKRRELTIQKGSLSVEEISKMQEDAQKNAEEDQKLEEVATSRQKLVEYVDSIKTQMGTKNIVNRMKSQDRNTIMAKLKTVLQWLKKGNGRSASKRLYLAQLKSLKRVVNPIITKVMNPAGTPLSDDDILGGDFGGEDQEEDPELADITEEDIQEVESGSSHHKEDSDIEVEGKKDEL